MAKMNKKKTNSKVQKNKKIYDISNIYRGFEENIEAIRVFIANLIPVAKKHDAVLKCRTDKVLNRFFKFVKTHKIELKNRKDSEIMVSGKENEKLFDILDQLPSLSPKNTELLYKSSFVTLISYFDFIVSDLIHYFYQVYPQSLTNKQLSISLSDLNSCADISDAVNYIVNKEVDNVLYDSLDKQLQYFQNALKIDCKKDMINWEIIEEAIARRNIIVHNDSMVNKRYLANINPSTLGKKMKEGSKISIQENYFNIILNEIFIAGIILVQCCWRKWKKDGLEDADSMFIDSIYEMLKKEKWLEAEKLGKFAKDIDVYDASSRLCFNINYCQSLKWQNKKNELDKELERFDSSTLSPKYVLALAALKGDRESFYKNIEKAVTADKMEINDFMEWPLFRELRRDHSYVGKVKRIIRRLKKK